MDSKQLTVIAGPNGSGKTTFAQEFLSHTPQQYLSADLIAFQLAPDDPASAEIAAGRVFLQRLGQSIAGSNNFRVYPTSGGFRS